MKVDVSCSHCGGLFLRNLNKRNEAIREGWNQYCGRECRIASKTTSEFVPCAECGETVKVQPKLKNRYPDSNRFCSQHCGAVFNNRNRPPRSAESREKVSQTLLSKSGNSRKPCPQCGTPTLRKFCGRACYVSSMTTYETPESVLAYIRQQTVLLGSSPSSKMDSSANHAAIRHFGSWNKAVEAAGGVPNTQWMIRKRITCNDGHIAESLAERVLDDWLFSQGIEHSRGKPYPEGRFTCDFYLPKYDAWVEYFGLAGEHSEYDAKIVLKTELAAKHVLRLVPVYPEDIFPEVRLHAGVFSFLEV